MRLTYNRFPIKFGLFVLLATGGSACSGGSDSEDLIFSDPTDAQSLRSALVTGQSANDNAEYWLCSTDSLTGNLIQYLYADGTGIEQLASMPTQQSAFAWQTLSATSMRSTIVNSGAQINISQIAFNGANNLSFSTDVGFSYTCTRQTEPQQNELPSDTPAPNSLSYGGISYALSHGFEESFSFSAFDGDTHSTNEFNVADAGFVQTNIFVTGTTVVVHRPNNATVWLRADLHTPGSEGVGTGVYNYVSNSVDENGSSVSGLNFFNEGRLGLDFNNDGSLESDDGEFVDITGGTISIERLGGTQAKMSFDVTAENGTLVSGSFEGSFPVYDHTFR